MVEIDIMYVCPYCGEPVSWGKIDLSNGSYINALDWECKKCGQQVIDFQSFEKE